jgi:hypothetical protein
MSEMRVIVEVPLSQRLILLPSLDYLHRNRMIKNKLNQILHYTIAISYIGRGLQEHMTASPYKVAANLLNDATDNRKNLYPRRRWYQLHQRRGEMKGLVSLGLVE